MRRKPKFYSIPLPAVSQEFAKQLSKRFPALTMRPEISRDEMLYNAGQRSIIDYILSVATGTTVTSEVSELKPTEHSVSLLDRLLGKIK